MMAMASRRRTAMVMLSTRTAIGSRPTSALVQDLDPGALDEAELDQPALELDVRERRAGVLGGEVLDDAGIAALGQAQRHLAARIMGVGHALYFQRRAGRSSARGR